MAGRPVDREHREELLDAAVDYAAARGFSDLTWRAIAAALGVSTTTLMHHFGTKEHLLEAILVRLRQRTVIATAALAGDEPDLATAAQAVWNWASHPNQAPIFTLFFAVYGNALQTPRQFSDFLDQISAEWMNTLRTAQGPHTDAAAADRNATLVIATIRGLLLDLLAGGDQARVRDAAEHFLRTLTDDS